MNVRRVLAPNPGPYTGEGTNTYVIGSGTEALVIDPGPVNEQHRSTILETLGDRVPVMVLVTHTHSDHAPLANSLASHLGVPAAGFGPGPGFKPDRTLSDNDVVPFGSAEVHVVATPGHSRDHLCYLAGEVLFTGDHIMGGSSVFVEDMSAYMASLRRLQELSLRTLYPGHGPPMHDPQVVIADYLSHRLEREGQILAAVRSGATSVSAIVEDVYAQVDPQLHPLAAVAVRAHLTKLDDERSVQFDIETDSVRSR
ncbi:MAG TPA: MBL fold metallo-hydrolase [Actinobacteria bacterium]|nr:putative polyketide biosynthesis zinc-dependent hydrolase PksB [bacterium BMS3Bbin01]HDH27107.1 MBL fold metallo-hydrolase [Actinomycetota bacterium]